MSRLTISWRQLAAVSAISLLAACNSPQPVASNPQSLARELNAVWYTVYFDTDSFALNADGRKVVNDVIASLQRNPGSVATVIGRTDTVGSKDYNIHLSHRRADAVRDAIVYDGSVALDRVETRWSGERRQNVPTANDVAAAENRVVDIAIH